MMHVLPLKGTCKHYPAKSPHHALLNAHARKIKWHRKSKLAVVSSSQQQAASIPQYPTSYEQVIRQATLATQACLTDGKMLLEIEFPPSGLDSVQGDGEGSNEMTASMNFLRQFVGGAFRDSAENVRIFWPDSGELSVALAGQTMDPVAGRSKTDPTFGDTVGSMFKMGYLTKQNALWSALGVNIGIGQKFSPVQQVKDSDQVFVIAYPHFNPREEMGAVFDIYQAVAQPHEKPIIIFNGELDRLRGGYYPSLFFPELARLTNEFLPKFETAYYIHNFKGTRPGVLFRMYPGPWCVFRRNPQDSTDLRLIYTSETAPSLKQVSLEILPVNGNVAL